jgi:hypothetical protein
MEATLRKPDTGFFARIVCRIRIGKAMCDELVLASIGRMALVYFTGTIQHILKQYAQIATEEMLANSSE